MQDIVNLINYKISVIAIICILCLCMVGPGALRTAYGQGTLVETVGTMEISQQVDNATNSAAPKGPADMRKPVPDANKVTGEPSRVQGIIPARPNPAETPAQPEPQERGRTETNVETPAAPVTTADINDFNAFKQEIDRIDMEARGEDAQWLGKQEKKAELAKAMDDVVVAELKFLKKVAAAANDANTVEAIDIVLKKRQDRLNKLVTKLENEVKEVRRQQMTERQPRRTAPRTGGAQQQDQTGPGGSNAPMRRPRVPVNPE